jgi:hypothetical protein
MARSDSITCQGLKRRTFLESKVLNWELFFAHNSQKDAIFVNLKAKLLQFSQKDATFVKREDVKCDTALKPMSKI